MKGIFSQLLEGFRDRNGKITRLLTGTGVQVGRNRLLFGKGEGSTLIKILVTQNYHTMPPLNVYSVGLLHPYVYWGLL
jgi:hypothetical protein